MYSIYLGFGVSSDNSLTSFGASTAKSCDDTFNDGASTFPSVVLVFVFKIVTGATSFWSFIVATSLWSFIEDELLFRLYCCLLF